MRVPNKGTKQAIQPTKVTTPVRRSASHPVDVQRLEEFKSQVVVRARRFTVVRSGHKPSPLTADCCLRTDFLAFPDGRVADLVRDRHDPGRLRFLVRNGESVTIRDYVVCNRQLFAPPRVDRSIIIGVRLPTGIGVARQPKDLLEDIVRCASEYISLPEDDLQLVAMVTLATWFVDRLRTAPFLWITGPLGSGKSALLKLLCCLCRRALPLGDFTKASLYSLPGLLHPTLLIDEGDFGGDIFSADVRRLLRTGSSPGFNAYRNGQLFETYCAKVIASRQVPQDAALTSRAIHISMSPTRRCLRPLNTRAMEQIAEAFQPALLAFRCANYSRVWSEPPIYVDTARFTPRVRDHLAALSGPLLSDPRLVEFLAHLLKRQDEAARVERSMEPESIVLESLLFQAHCDRGAQWILVGTLASVTNATLKERGENFQLSARAVGAILKSSGIRTEKVGSFGRGLRLTDIRRKIHALAASLGLKLRDFSHLASSEGRADASPCELCGEYGLTQ